VRRRVRRVALATYPQKKENTWLHYYPEGEKKESQEKEKRGKFLKSRKRTYL